MNMNEAYEAAGRAKEILNIEHAIDIGQIKSIDDVRAALRSSSAEIAENLNAHGFEGWVNGVPIFKNGHELNATMARVNCAMQVANRIQNRSRMGFLFEIDATFITGREYMSTDGSTHRRIGQYQIKHGQKTNQGRSLITTNMAPIKRSIKLVTRAEFDHEKGKAVIQEAVSNHEFQGMTRKQ